MKDQNNNVIAALSEEHISKVTGLSYSQLRRWDKRGFFSPAHAYENRSSAFSRIYSFEDAVGLRTIATLRSAPYRISVKRLENLAEKMESDGIANWAEAKIWVVKGEPCYWRPNFSEVVGSETGQLSMLPVIEVIEEVKSRVDEIKVRSSNSYGKVERHRHIARNAWVVSGTRIPTATIRRYNEAGFTTSQILEEYPTLRHEDIEAALRHEKRLAKSA